MKIGEWLLAIVLMAIPMAIIGSLLREMQGYRLEADHPLLEIHLLVLMLGLIVNLQYLYWNYAISWWRKRK